MPVSNAAAWPAGHPSEPVPEIENVAQERVGNGDLWAWGPYDYDRYLGQCGLLGNGFRFSELVDPTRHDKQTPPIEMWSHMVPTLRVAAELRRRMIEHGASGLNVNAAYRPKSRKRRSAHRQNCALDLDLLSGEATGRLGRVFVEVAAGLFGELLADGLSVGVGTYGPNLWTKRVHIDVGYDHPYRSNTWTKHKGEYIAQAIAEVLERKG